MTAAVVVVLVVAAVITIANGEREPIPQTGRFNQNHSGDHGCTSDNLDVNDGHEHHPDPKHGPTHNGQAQADSHDGSADDIRADDESTYHHWPSEDDIDDDWQLHG